MKLDGCTNNLGPKVLNVSNYIMGKLDKIDNVLD